MVVIALCIMLFINGIMGLHLYNNSYCFHLKKNHFYGLKSMTQCGDKLLDNPILPDSAMAELVLSSVIAFFSIIIMFATFQNIDSEGSTKYSVLLTVLNLICTAFTIYIYVECVQKEPDAGTLNNSDSNNVYCSVKNNYQELGILYSIVYLFCILVSVLILIISTLEMTPSQKSNNNNTRKVNSNNNVKLNKNNNNINRTQNTSKYGLNKNTNLQFSNEKKNNNSNNVNLNKTNNNSANKPNNNKPNNNKPNNNNKSINNNSNKPNNTSNKNSNNSNKSNNKSNNKPNNNNKANNNSNKSNNKANNNKKN